MIAPWANVYVGIPFVSGGRTHAGCDCYGLLRLVWGEQYDNWLPLLSNDYIDALNPHQTGPLFDEYVPLLTGIRHGVPQTGDAVVILNRGLPTHLAVFAGGGYILHTVRSVGTVMQRLTDRDLTGRIEGYYGIKTADTNSSIPGLVQ